MLNKISEKFHAWTTGWRVIILLTAESLMMFYIMPLAAGIMAFAANNSVLPLDPGIHRISIRKDGYKTFRLEVVVRDESIPVEVTLEPAAPGR